MCSVEEGTTIAMKPGGSVSLVRRSAIGDALMSMGALIVLLGILAAFDPRVREQVSLSLSPGAPSAQIAQASTTVRSLSGVVIDAVRDQSIEHAPMVIFVMAGVVLLLFMLRT
jgi:hypothetical protein